jgi:hypothetical protein
MMISQIKGGRFDEQVFEEAPARPTATTAAEGETKVRLPVGARRGGAGPEPDAVPAVAPAPRPTTETPAPPPAAAAAAGAPAGEEPATLDQVIFDYLASAANQEHLVLMMDESPALASGQSSGLEFKTYTSRSGQPIGRATVTVRMNSTQAPPRTLGEGATDDSGELALAVQVPEATRGTAALIITASSELGDAEIRHLL